MNQSPTSLDRLHDLALPPEVSWWPLAPGWYVVILLVLALLLAAAFRAVRHWRANAYRRAALRELASLESPAAISELLRRMALAIAPRSVIAEMTCTAWLDWLAAQGTEPLPEAVRTQLTVGVYGRTAAGGDLDALRKFASRWITNHQPVAAEPADDQRIKPCPKSIEPPSRLPC